MKRYILSIEERNNRIQNFKLGFKNQTTVTKPHTRAIVNAIERVEEVKIRHFASIIENRRDNLEENRKIRSLILKPVGINCNLSCTYCYHEKNTKNMPKRYQYSKSNSLMGESLLERVISQAADFLFGSIEFIWHGGEPLLAGMDFYKRAIKLQRKYRKKGLNIKNSIQTNGTLLDRRWIEFFRKNSFHLGFSLDGSKSDHDLCRIYPSYRGSYDDVIKSLRLVKSSGVKVAVIATVIPFHQKDPCELMATFLKERVSQVRIHPSFHRNLLLSPEEFADYVIALFDEWLENGGSKIRFSIFEDIFRGLMGFFPKTCCYNGNCGSHLSIEPNGDVWLCDLPFLREEYRFGNIIKTNLPNIMKSENYQKFCKVKQKIQEECRSSCRWYFLCAGDCLYHRSFKTGRIEGKSYYCKGLKKILGYITNRFDQILEELNCPG